MIQKCMVTNILNSYSWLKYWYPEYHLQQYPHFEVTEFQQLLSLNHLLWSNISSTLIDNPQFPSPLTCVLGNYSDGLGENTKITDWNVWL